MIPTNPPAGASIDQASPFLELYSFPNPDLIPLTQVENVCRLLHRITKHSGAFHPEKSPTTIRVKPESNVGSTSLAPLTIRRFVCHGEEGHACLKAVTRSGQLIPAEELFLHTGHCLLDAVFFDRQPTFAPWLTEERLAKLTPLKPGGLQVARLARIDCRRLIQA